MPGRRGRGRRAARRAEGVLLDTGLEPSAVREALRRLEREAPIAPRHRPDLDPDVFIRERGAGGRPVTEREFQTDVLDLARQRAWLHYHTFDSRRSPEGFPDLVLARRLSSEGEADRAEVLFAELKRAKGRTSDAQERWLRLLRAAGLEAYVWRPSDRAEIVARLT